MGWRSEVEQSAVRLVGVAPPPHVDGLGVAERAGAAAPARPSLAGLTGWLRECGVVAPVGVVHGGEQGEAPDAHAVRRVMRDAGYGAIAMSPVTPAWSATRFAMPA